MPVPVAPLITTALALGQGLMQASKGKSATRTGLGQHAAIPGVDPAVGSLIAELELKSKYADAGQSRMLGYKRNMITNAGVQGDNNLSRVAGSSPGSALEAMLRNRNVTAQSLARAGAESEGLGASYTAMRAPLVQDMADRKLSLSTYLRDYNMMKGAQHTQNANNAFSGTMGILSQLDLGSLGKAGGGGGGGGMFTPPMSAGNGLPAAPGIGGDAMEWDWSQPPGNAFSLPDATFG